MVPRQGAQPHTRGVQPLVERERRGKGFPSLGNIRRYGAKPRRKGTAFAVPFLYAIAATARESLPLPIHMYS